ncbi:MAG: Ubiquinone biosynthesis O-methyltransferase [Phycisphaerae bacterium]|nr:Ubiquinone biosynthesis O-methyltransferase [Phycisphaerae bacterium]
MQATEKTSLGQALTRYPDALDYLRRILRRLAAVAPVPDGGDVLDVGAAQGLFVAAAWALGYRAAGIEPYGPARELAARVGRKLGAEVELTAASAERLPFPDASFDLVLSTEVWEHADDPAAGTREAFRVLRPGGWFWLATTNALCPRQNEIAAFPAFSWYPLRLKRRIMRWAQARRPALIGHNDRPAIHWHTPGGWARMARDAGFATVYDRWDMRLPDEGGPAHAAALRLIRSCRLTRWLAFVVSEGTVLAARKG